MESMNSMADVKTFLSKKRIAIAGVSRSGNKFGNMAAKELKKKGYEIYPVNPEADEIQGEKCYRSIAAIETAPEGALIITPPGRTAEAVKDALDAGVKDIWIQQGAESEQAAELAGQSGGRVISGECVLMFAEPTAFYHKIHRWIWRALGKLPS